MSRCAIAFNGRSSDGPERRWSSFFVYWCAIASNARSSDGPERWCTSFLVSLYQCAVWLVSMLAYMLVSILRLVDSVPLLCTFLEVSTCVVVSALWLKPGSATVLELSFSSCWKFCGTFLECVCVLSIVLPDINVCHDLEEILWVPNFYYICQICCLRLGVRSSGFAHD